jgi:hypothetical protein
MYQQPPSTGLILAGVVWFDYLTEGVGFSIGRRGAVIAGVVVSTAHVRSVRLASLIPAASMARTRKVWKPYLRSVYSLGEVHRLKTPPSMLHANLELTWVEENPNVTEELLATPEIPETIS